ncbi:MAG: hypothetical protein MJH10_17225, partial [Epibacterium sp.]|nr:hypothetical protein [Epibacterium sp.]NQX75251.1 hypothetical protein [Epibacterium sp.]
MADLIELDLVVKEKDLKSSISTVERLERQLIKASKAIEQNSVSQGRYNKILLSAKRQYEQLGLSSQKATSQVHSFAKAQRASLKEASEVAQATKRASEAYAQARKEAEEANRAFDSQASAYQRLVRSMDPAYDATQRFKEAQRVLRAELSTGRISIGRYNEQLLLARKTMEVTTASSGQMGRMMSRNGVMVQQAGYQIGDFLVQVQSGQNAMVAFGQQATQMAGTLTLLGGAFVGIGTALGIAIPLITAAGAAFMRTRGSAKDAEEEVKTFEQRLSSSQSAIIAARDSIVDLSEEGLEVLRDRFGEVTEQVTTLETRLRGIALQNMVTEVQGAMDELFSDSFFDEIEEGFGNIGSAILETAPEDIKELEREISSLQAILDSTAFPSPLLQGQLKELQEELAAVTLDFQNIGSLTDELEVSSDTINSYKSLEEAVK